MALSDLLTSRLSKPASRVLDAPIRDAIHDILREAGYASPAELQSLRDELRDLRGQLNHIEKRAAEMASQLEAARADADPRVATLASTLSALEASTDKRLSELEARVHAEISALRSAPVDSRLSALAEQVAAFPSLVEQRLASIEARLTVLPASLENRIEDLEARLESQPVVAAPAEVAEAFAEALAATEAPEPEAVVPVPLAPGPRLDCKVDGCDRANRSKGFCSSHYQQWRRGTLKGFLSPEGTVLVDGRIVSGGVDRAAQAYTVVDGKVYAEGMLIG